MSIESLPNPADLEADSNYNALDTIITARCAQKMDSHLRASLFDQALQGPSLTCQLRGLRVDRGRLQEARIKLDERTRETQDRFEKLTGQRPWKKGSKPSSQALSAILYQRFKVRARLSRDTENPTVAKNVLYEILEDAKTPEEAIPIVECHLELSRLEEDRKALEKPLSPDGRMHSSFMISASISARWGSRKDCYGDGMNLHSASDIVRHVFIPDPGYIMVSMDQMQAESKCVAFLAGSQWYIDAHERGNVHVESGKIFFPQFADVITKKWAKSTPWPSDPLHNYYDMMKRLQHAGNYKQTARGVARHAHITTAEARSIQKRYFARMPEIPAWHEWIKHEINTRKRLVSPLGRVRQFLGRVWEESVVREAVSWQPQSCVSDITKSVLYRLWRHLDPGDLQVLLEHHDSVLWQVREAHVDRVLHDVAPMCDIPIPIGPRTMRIGWEAKRGPSWGELDADENPIVMEALL